MIRKVYFPTPPGITTTISIADIDGNGDLIDGVKDKRIVLTDDCFDFRACNKQQIRDRLKTVLVFY